MDAGGGGGGGGGGRVCVCVGGGGDGGCWQYVAQKSLPVLSNYQD